MVSVEDVWYCKVGHDPVATVAEKGPVVCQECKKEMHIIGWFETDDKRTKEQEDRAGDE